MRTDSQEWTWRTHLSAVVMILLPSPALRLLERERGEGRGSFWTNTPLKTMTPSPLFPHSSPLLSHRMDHGIGPQSVQLQWAETTQYCKFISKRLCEPYLLAPSG